MKGFHKWVPDHSLRCTWFLCAYRLNILPQEVIEHIASFFGEFRGPFHPKIPLQFTEAQNLLYQSSQNRLGGILWNTTRKSGASTALAGIILTEILVTQEPIHIVYCTTSKGSVERFAKQLVCLSSSDHWLMFSDNRQLRLHYKATGSNVMISCNWDIILDIRSCSLLLVDHCESHDPYLFHRVYIPIIEHKNIPVVLCGDGERHNTAFKTLLGLVEEANLLCHVLTCRSVLK